MYQSLLIGLCVCVQEVKDDANELDEMSASRGISTDINTSFEMLLISYKIDI